MLYRHLITQPNLNAHGTLHGGVLMKWVDEACGMEARLTSGHVCATVHIDNINFIGTARLGDIVEIDITPGEIGNTSIAFSAIVNIAKGEQIASFGKVIFVAIDELHRPRPIKVKNES